MKKELKEVIEQQVKESFGAYGGILFISSEFAPLSIEEQIKALEYAKELREDIQHILFEERILTSKEYASEHLKGSEAIEESGKYLIFDSSVIGMIHFIYEGETCIVCGKLLTFDETCSIDYTCTSCQEKEEERSTCKSCGCEIINNDIGYEDVFYCGLCVSCHSDSVAGRSPEEDATEACHCI